MLIIILILLQIETLCRLCRLLINLIILMKLILCSPETFRTNCSYWWKSVGIRKMHIRLEDFIRNCILNADFLKSHWCVAIV